MSDYRSSADLGAIISTLRSRVATLERENATPSIVDVNSQAGTTYTLALTDADRVVECSNAGAVTVTIPPNSSVAFVVGTVIEVFQLGAGAVSVAQGAGVTLQPSSPQTCAGQYKSLRLRKRATDTWVAE